MHSAVCLTGFGYPDCRSNSTTTVGCWTQSVGGNSSRNWLRQTQVISPNWGREFFSDCGSQVCQPSVRGSNPRWQTVTCSRLGHCHTWSNEISISFYSTISSSSNIADPSGYRAAPSTTVVSSMWVKNILKLQWLLSIFGLKRVYGVQCREIHWVKFDSITKRFSICSHNWSIH